MKNYKWHKLPYFFFLWGLNRYDCNFSTYKRNKTKNKWFSDTLKTGIWSRVLLGHSMCRGLVSIRSTCFQLQSKPPYLLLEGWKVQQLPAFLPLFIVFKHILDELYLENPLFKGTRSTERLKISLNRNIIMLWQGCVIWSLFLS